jgi:hypothetical protein
MTLDERLEQITESLELLGRRQKEEWERSREEYARWRQAVREEEERRHEAIRLEEERRRAEDERLRAEAREADARFQTRIDGVLEGIDALARLAGVQGVRLNNHENRISALEKGTPPSAE